MRLFWYKSVVGKLTRCENIMAKRFCFRTVLSTIPIKPCLILLLIFLPIGVFGQESDFEMWSVYNDLQYPFSIECPTNWTVELRIASFESGGTITFRDPHNIYVIVIGQHGSYSYKGYENETLFDITKRKMITDGSFAPEKMTYSIQKELNLNEMEAVFIRGVSPLTEFQYTNIQKDKTVWFIWSNMGEGTGKEYLDIYDRMVRSFVFDTRPSTLPVAGAELPNNSNLLFVLGITMLFVGWRMTRQNRHLTIKFNTNC